MSRPSTRDRAWSARVIGKHRRWLITLAVMRAFWRMR
jgi:hypothetical protein